MCLRTRTLNLVKHHKTKRHLFNCFNNGSLSRNALSKAFLGKKIHFYENKKSGYWCSGFTLLNIEINKYKQKLQKRKYHDTQEHTYEMVNK